MGSLTRNNGSGMTLAEIMAVIALIGVIGMWMLNFDFESATDKERRDRFVTKVASVIRYAKTASVSWRTSTTGNCSGYVIAVGANAMTGTMASFSETWAVLSTCWTDPDSSILAPMLGDSQSYRITAITWLSSSDVSQFRIAPSGDYSGTTGTTGTMAAILINGSNLSAYPLTCSNPVTCTDYSKDKTVKLKLNLSYRQPNNVRTKNASRDLFLDLRSWNVEIKDPVAP